MVVFKTHAGSFSPGQVGATYTITPQNIGAGVAQGTVTVVDTLPPSLTATAMSGIGWNCTVATATCTASTSGIFTLAPITLTVNVAANAPASVTNSATVSGGGETNTSNNT